MTTKEEVLQNCVVEDLVVKLPPGQLDRKLYQDVAKSLELIGGKWKGGKVAGFVFPHDPSDLLDQIANGEKRNLKKEYQAFFTPAKLADALIYLADLKSKDDTLEPSCGQGAIIRAINKVTTKVPDCYELMETNRMILAKTGLNYNLIGDNFLLHERPCYDKIIANPPFSKNQDIDHVKKMWQALRTKGRIVTVTSESWETGSQKKQVEFREWLDSIGAQTLDVPAGAFKESGTEIATKILIIDKKG